MSTEEKLYLTTAIIANEYAKFHDVITFTNFLIDKDESKVVFLTTHFNFLLKDIVTPGVSPSAEEPSFASYSCSLSFNRLYA